MVSRRERSNLMNCVFAFLSPVHQIVIAHRKLILPKIMEFCKSLLSLTDWVLFSLPLKVRQRNNQKVPTFQPHLLPSLHQYSSAILAKSLVHLCRPLMTLRPRCISIQFVPTTPVVQRIHAITRRDRATGRLRFHRCQSVQTQRPSWGGSGFVYSFALAPSK
jgi:hypothetical protein